MKTVRYSEEAVSPERQAVSAKTLRTWCAPELLLAVTDLSDDMMIMPHIINQARHSSAKIILAHVVTSDSDIKCRTTSLQQPVSRIQQARTALDRMARHLQWLGFICEPLVLSGRPEIEVPILAQSLFVDRVILTMQDNPELSLHHVPTLAERILPGIEVPTCIIGRCVSLSHRLYTRNITLAISLDSDCKIPLGFASRLAQELRAKLTVFHAFHRDGVSTPDALAATLPSPTWREAELFCPTEIKVKEGDAADEILNHCLSTQQDLIILCSRRNPFREQNWRSSVTYRVLAGAQCPVIILDRRCASQIAQTSPALERMPVQREISIENLRGESTNRTFELGARSNF